MDNCDSLFYGFEEKFPLLPVAIDVTAQAKSNFDKYETGPLFRLFYYRYGASFTRDYAIDDRLFAFRHFNELELLLVQSKFCGKCSLLIFAESGFDMPYYTLCISSDNPDWLGRIIAVDGTRGLGWVNNEKLLHDTFQDFLESYVNNEMLF